MQYSLHDSGTRSSSTEKRKLFFNNVSKQPEQLYSKNGGPHSLNEPHVIITPNFWGEARLVS